MFQIKIEDQSHYKNEKFPYQILYEQAPDISKGSGKLVIHQSRFSNLKKAQKVANDLSNFLDESFIFLDLIYTKLKQLEICDVSENQYLKIDFNSIEKSRILLFKTRSLFRPAYTHISNIDSFIQHLKYWCFNVSKQYYTTADKLFQFLLSFEEHFKNSYRSAQILSDSKKFSMF